MKDYYRILEVSPEATHDEIKRAFKILAKKHHPDTAGSAPDHIEQFKEIAEAYAILGNVEARRKYDQERAEKSTFKFSRPSPFSPPDDDFVGSFFDRVAQSRFGGKPRQSRPGPGMGHSGFANLFDNESFQAGTAKPLAASLRVPLRFAFQGGEVEVSGLPGGLLHLVLPSGIGTGTILEVKSSQGPVELRVQLEDEPPFQIRGTNLETEVPINIVQAILGSQLDLAHPNGDSFTVKIPAGTQPGSMLRLKGLGLPGGDLLVRLDLHLPRHLTREQEDLLREFARKADMPL